MQNASVKFRDGQKPLFKLKMPVNMLGVPLQTGVTVGDGEDFGFHVSTSIPLWRTAMTWSNWVLLVAIVSVRLK
jgi:hypothetical protein